MLENFRNHAVKKFDFTGGVNVLHGNNGIGKTNTLEALSFLAPGRGMRSAELEGVLNKNVRVREGIPLWTIRAEIDGNDKYDSLAVYTEFKDNKIRRNIKLNDNFTAKQEDLATLFSMIWLTPQMNQFFDDSSSVRRKFLDRSVYITDSKHSTRVNKHDFLIRERMKLLTDSPIYDKNWISVLEQKIADLALEIAILRRNTVVEMNKILLRHNFKFPNAEIVLVGQLENMLDSQSPDEVKQEYLRILMANRGLDAHSKRTTSGVHRSDIRVVYLEKCADGAMCSTGEQQLLMISMTLARAILCRETGKSEPILLLDDISSHLDRGKRNDLFEEITKLDVSTFITGTDIEYFDFLRDMPGVKFFNLEENAD